MVDATERRTQESRRKETSDAIIRATVDLLERLGYSNLRTKHITQEANVTWGAVQYLFGGKDDLMLSVVRHTLDKITAQIDQISFHQGSLEERCDRIIDLTWDVYDSKDYFALIEIVRGTKSVKDLHQKIVAAHQRVRSHIQHVWIQAFRDASVSEEQLILTCEHMTLMLSGLASRRRYLWPRIDTATNLTFAKRIAQSMIRGELKTAYRRMEAMTAHRA